MQDFDQSQLQRELRLPATGVIVDGGVEGADGFQQPAPAQSAGQGFVGAALGLRGFHQVDAGCLRQHDIAQMRHHLLPELPRIAAAVDRQIDQVNPAGDIFVRQGVDQLPHLQRMRRAQQVRASSMVMVSSGSLTI